MFTLGIGGVLCYYVWTAKKKVDLFNQLEKSGPSKIVETGKKVKQASETLQTHTERPQKNLVNVDELLNQIKEHPGYKPEWKNISSATLHANFMQAPVNSYCIIPEEGLGSEEKVFRLIKVVEKDHKKSWKFKILH
ncbi:MAG: hypothetical protein HWD61_10275 [Parachlamydiaceae bacterium]|nr:MAG: hypothetical protein HWD61_10275 [Parachlamydiaceae bacterium]